MTNGTRADLQRLGLTPDAAVGRRFTFYSEDADADGRPDDIMFNGVIVRDPKYEYLAVADEDGFYWRSEIDDAAF